LPPKAVFVWLNIASRNKIPVKARVFALAIQRKISYNKIGFQKDGGPFYK
jgi:hypothetical protein